MKKYSKKLLNLFNELHIVDVKKSTDPLAPEFYVNFDVKSQDLIIFMEKDFKENKILTYLLSIKDDIKTYYEECINLAKLPLQTSFKVNEIEGFPVQYEVDEDACRMAYSLEPLTCSFVISYKSIYSTRVDKFIEDHLDELTDIAKNLNDSAKFILEHNDKYVPANDLIPYEMSGIPIVYHCGDDVENMNMTFDEKQLVYKISVNPKCLNQLVAKINDFYIYLYVNGSHDKASDVVLHHLKMINEKTMCFNYSDYENEKLVIWGEDYKIEQKFSDEYPVLTKDTRYTEVLEVDDDKKLITYKLNPQDAENDELELFMIDLLHLKMEQVLPEYLKLCNDNGIELKELTPDQCDGSIYKFNKYKKKLVLTLLLGGYPKRLTKFVTLWGALQLKYELGSDDFYKKLTEIIPDWPMDAAFLLDFEDDDDGELAINVLGVREILNRY
ncbi:MAG: hypothetical protein UHG91_01185 [Succinivibrionaceae bacterium]|nr:hypothetical protein [Succinivibrionaceae bacterium]